MLVQLGEKGVKTLDDLADLAGDELVEIVGEAALDRGNGANGVIMAARAHWFDGEDGAVAAVEEPGEAPEAEEADNG